MKSTGAFYLSITLHWPGILSQIVYAKDNQYIPRPARREVSTIEEGCVCYHKWQRFRSECTMTALNCDMNKFIDNLV